MKKKIRFRHLDQYDRDRIEALLKAGHKQKEIAGILQVNKGTISREIKRRRRKDGRYVATAAQHKANVRRANSKYQGMKIERHPGLRNFIIEQLQRYRSPDEIAGRMRREKQNPRVNANAIYKWLYTVYGQRYARYLCTRRMKRKPQKRKPKSEMIPHRISVWERPQSGTLRHWEGDTMVSPKRANTTASVAVASAIQEKYLCAVKIENLRPESMKHAIQQKSAHVYMDTLTLDNGIENRYHEEFGPATYFCDPHSPWQKPHVENSIGLLRRWFLPKGTNLNTVSEEALQMYIGILNNKYRKSLQYESAYEVAVAHGILQTEVAFH
jgi:IS30 family transposase